MSAYCLMIATNSNTTADFVVALLIHYSFDLGGYSAGELIDHWLNDYPANWVRLAVVEALYQGRYKAISVEQILVFWNRRGQPVYHFKHEFERLICSNFPQTGQPNIKANAPSVSESAPYLSNNHERQAVTTQQVSGNKTLQLVDANANIRTATNQIAKKQALACHQTSDNNPRWLPHSNASLPIEQFTPEKTDGSDFYSKLKAIAHSTRYTLAASVATEPKMLAPAVPEGKP